MKYLPFVHPIHLKSSFSHKLWDFLVIWRCFCPGIHRLAEPEAISETPMPVLVMANEENEDFFSQKNWDFT